MNPFESPFADWGWEPVMPPMLILLALTGLLVLAFRATVWLGFRSWVPQPLLSNRLEIRWRVLFFLLRSVAILVLGLILLNPIRSTTDGSSEDASAKRPLLHIMVDDSRSMSTQDVIGEGAERLSRYDAMRSHWLTADFVSALANVVEPVFYRVGKNLRRSSAAELRNLEPLADGSRLAEHLRSVLNSTGIQESAGVLLLSDGRDTTGEGLLQVLNDFDGGIDEGSGETPIYVVPLGSEEVPADLAVHLIAEDTDVYRGQSTTLHAEIRQKGYENRIVDVVLHQNGAGIERQRLRLEGGRSRLRFAVTPVGAQGSGALSGATIDLAEYTIAVEAFPDERTRQNNVRHTFIRIHEERIRVAVFEDSPYWDTRFLIQALRADPQVELTTFMGINDRIEHTARYEAATTSTNDQGQVDLPEPMDPLGLGSGSAIDIVVPTSAASLAEYNVVILGQGIERWFPGLQAQELVDYVLEHGGNIIFARGVPCRDETEAGTEALQILERISPVAWGTNRLVVAGQLIAAGGGGSSGPIEFEALGQTDRVLTRLPGMLAQTEILREKAFSMVWLRSQDESQELTADRNRNDGSVIESEPAAVAHFRAGRGQTLAVLTHGLWQWALLPPTPTAEHRGGEDGELHGAFEFFWHRCLRWLAREGELLPGQSVKLSLDRLAAEPGDTVEVRVETRFIDPAELTALAASVILPDGTQSTIELSSAGLPPNHLAGRIEVEIEGIHRVVLQTRSQEPIEIERRFAVHATDREMINPALDREGLEMLARQSHGAVLRFDQADALLDHIGKTLLFEGQKKNPVPAWATLAAYLGLVLALGGEWILRRRCGLA